MNTRRKHVSIKTLIAAGETVLRDPKERKDAEFDIEIGRFCVRMPFPKDPLKAAETRRKMSEAAKKRFEDPEFRAKFGEIQKKAKSDPEYRRKMGDVVKKRFEDPEFRAKFCEIQKKAKSDPEYRKKASEAQKERYKDPGALEKNRQAAKKLFEDPEFRKEHLALMEKGRNTPEARMKQIEALKKYYANPDARAYVGKNTKKRANDPTYRAKFSEAQKKAKSNPEYRKKASENTKKQFADPEARRKVSDVTKQQYLDHCWYGHPMPEAEYCGKFNDDLKERVRAFFGYKCLGCNTPQNEKALAVHHVHNDKEACCAGSPYRSFVALCPSCHAIVTYSKDQKKWMNYYQDIIDTLYEGQSFFERHEMAEYTSIPEWADEKLALVCARKWIKSGRAKFNTE